MSSYDDHGNDQSRRRFVRTAVYTAPFILTLKAEPAFASYGSGIPNTTNEGTGASPRRHPVLRSLFGHSQPGDRKKTPGFLRRLLNSLGRTQP